MGSQKHGLLSQVTGPVRLNFLYVLVSVLSVALRVNIVPLRRLQCCIPITFNFKIRVRYDDRALRMIKISHGSGYQKVAQLHFEKLRFLVKEEECSIDRLDDDHRLLVWPEVTDDEVECIALEVQSVDFLVRGERIVVHDEGDCEFSRVQDADSDRVVWIGSFEMLLRDFGAN